MDPRIVHQILAGSIGRPMYPMFNENREMEKACAEIAERAYADQLNQCGDAGLDSATKILSEVLISVHELNDRLRASADQFAGPEKNCDSVPSGIEKQPCILDLCRRVRSALRDSHNEMSRIARSL